MGSEVVTMPHQLSVLMHGVMNGLEECLMFGQQSNQHAAVSSQLTEEEERCLRNRDSETA